MVKSASPFQVTDALVSPTRHEPPAVEGPAAADQVPALGPRRLVDDMEHEVVAEEAVGVLHLQQVHARVVGQPGSRATGFEWGLS